MLKINSLHLASDVLSVVEVGRGGDRKLEAWTMAKTFYLSPALISARDKG